MDEMRNNCLQEITDFVRNNFLFHQDGTEISVEESLIDNGVIDSTGVLELIDFLEDKYEISVENDEVVPENLGSINHMCDFIMRKKK